MGVLPAVVSAGRTPGFTLPPRTGELEGSSVSPAVPAVRAVCDGELPPNLYLLIQPCPSDSHPWWSQRVHLVVTAPRAQRGFGGTGNDMPARGCPEQRSPGTWVRCHHGYGSGIPPHGLRAAPEPAELSCGAAAAHRGLPRAGARSSLFLEIQRFPDTTEPR